MVIGKMLVVRIIEINIIDPFKLSEGCPTEQAKGLG